jgi:hypothetical protein
MAILQLQAKDALIRIGAFDALNCIQSFSWDSAMNAEQLAQLGSATYDAQTITPEVTAQFEARATGSLAAMLSRMIYTLDPATGEFQGPMGTANTTLIRETDLERAVFDLIESKKANEVFDRSTLITRAHLSSFSMAVRTDGHATESYNVMGDVLEIFRLPFHDLIALPVVRAAVLPELNVVLPLTYTAEGTGVVVAADWKIYALDIDGIRVPAADLTVTNGAVKGTNEDSVAISGASLAAGVVIPKGAKLALIMWRKVPGTFPIIEYPTTARFVKADQADIFLVSQTATYTADAQTDTVAALLGLGVDLNDIPFTSTDQLLRVQSLDMTVDLRREALKEIKKTNTGNSIYYRAATYPLNVTSQLSVLESDLNEWAKIQGKNLYGSLTPDILNLNDFENRPWIIVVRYYKKGATLQTVAFLDARTDNPGHKIAVGGRAEMSYSFTGSALAIQGVAI